MLSPATTRFFIQDHCEQDIGFPVILSAVSELEMFRDTEDRQTLGLLLRKRFEARNMLFL